MRLALVIFKKDLRRLWWEWVVSLAVIAVLTYLDANRFDFVPGPTESMLNFLAPAVWAYLLAMLVHQEALVGDRQFWLTRPYPRAALLLAKLIGAVILIHVPALISDWIIVAAHDFSPLAHFTALLWKQGAIAGVLTLPALAIAAVTRNLPQFAFGVILAALAGVLVVSTVDPFSAPWIAEQTLRKAAALSVMCGGSAVVIALQYWVRRTGVARALGVVTAISAAAVFMYLTKPDRGYWSGPQAPTEKGNMTVTLAPDRGAPVTIQFRDAHYGISIPIRISGAPAPQPVRVVGTTRFGVRTASGESWAVPGMIYRERLEVGLKPDIFERVAQQPVTIEGTIHAIVYASGAATMGARSGPVNVPGLGKCMSGPAHDGLLRVICESPGATPMAGVRLLGGGPSIVGGEQNLGDSAPFVRYPLMPWLSPLKRRQTFFHIRPPGDAIESQRWMVPSDELDGARVELQHVREARRIASDYRLGPFKLADYLPPQTEGSLR